MKFNFNKKANFDEENLDNIWVVDMWLDNMDSKDGHDHIEFTKIGLIDFLNNEMEDYNNTNGAYYTALDRNATNEEVKEVLYDLLEGKVVEIKPYNEKTASKKVKAEEVTDEQLEESWNKYYPLYRQDIEAEKMTEENYPIDDEVAQNLKTSLSMYLRELKRYKKAIPIMKYHTNAKMKRAVENGHSKGLSEDEITKQVDDIAEEYYKKEQKIKPTIGSCSEDYLKSFVFNIIKNKTAKKQVKAEKEPKTKIDVLFKLEKPEGIDGLDVVAWFLSDPDTCYSHFGQHSSCDPEYMASLEEAKFTDYEYLLKELENIGYKVNVMNSDYKQQKKASRKFTFIKKKAGEETENYITVWLYPGSGASLYGFATVADNEEEALENVADYLVEKQLHSFYMTPQEYQDFMKDFYDDLSEEELEEKMENDETVMYVDTGRGAVVYLTGFENAKIEKGINESYIDDIAIIDGNRAKSGPLSKWSKQASKKVKSELNFDGDLFQIENIKFDVNTLKSKCIEKEKGESATYRFEIAIQPDKYIVSNDRGGDWVQLSGKCFGEYVSYAGDYGASAKEVFADWPQNCEFGGFFSANGNKINITYKGNIAEYIGDGVAIYIQNATLNVPTTEKNTASLKRKAGTSNFNTQEDYPLIAIGDEQVYPQEVFVDEWNEENPDEPIGEWDEQDGTYYSWLDQHYDIIKEEMEDYLKNADIPEGWNITLKPGYYEGVQLWVEEPNDFEYYFEQGWLDDKELGYDELTPEQKAELQNAMQAQYEKEKAQVAQIMIDAAKACGWLQLKVDWRASNGETGYSVVKSGLNKQTMEMLHKTSNWIEEKNDFAILQDKITKRYALFNVSEEDFVDDNQYDTLEEAKKALYDLTYESDNAYLEDLANTYSLEFQKVRDIADLLKRVSDTNEGEQVIYYPQFTEIVKKIGIDESDAEEITLDLGYRIK